MGAYAPGSYWYYAPNKGAPFAFAVLFLISGLWHVYQIIRSKTFRMTFLLPWAAVLFVAGFALREAGAFDYDNRGIFVASTVLLLLAPPVYAGANYFILGRLLSYVPYNSPIHPGRVVSTFVGLDVVVGALTANGASKVSDTSISRSQQEIGSALLKASLILQIVLIAGFMAITARFHVNCVRAKTFNAKIRTVLLTLYVSCVIILIRCIFRSVEYFQAADDFLSRELGPLITTEAYFWVFEASLMLINSFIFNVWHPGKFLPLSCKVYLGRDGVTEFVGTGFVDKRPFLVTVFDPCDIYGLLRGHDEQTAFWDRGEGTRAPEQMAEPSPAP